MRAFLAAAFWSPPAPFFSLACLAAFFCWDWIFCWPRAIAKLYRNQNNNGGGGGGGGGAIAILYVNITHADI